MQSSDDVNFTVGGAAVNGFDPQGAPTSVTTTIANGNTPIVWTVTPSCYDNGAVHVLTTPAGPYTYAYDGLGRLHKIIAPDLRETWDYDQTNGQLSRKTLPNGAYTTDAYNDLGQVSGLINYDVNDMALSTYDNFAYDTDGRLVSYDTTFGVNTALDGARAYSYDEHDRLATESYLRWEGLLLVMSLIIELNAIAVVRTRHTIMSPSGCQLSMMILKMRQEITPATHSYVCITD